MNIANKEELVKNENPVNHEQYIEVPRGWNRCLENGSIVYFSPSQICLRSKEDVARYLISDRTCKCGLDCPLYIDKVFNFDPSLQSNPCKLSKLENDHKTLCQETIKARFVTLAQTQTANESSEVKENKAVIIKKKSEASLAKGKIETQALPSFETFVSLADAAQNQETKPKKPRRPALNKKKPSVTVTSTIPVSKATASVMPTCQTVHTNTTPILHSSVEIQNSTSKDVTSKTLPYTAVSTGAVFSTSEHARPQNVGSLFTFPSAQLNASSFLAALSSATTIPSHTRPAEVNHPQKVHPLLPHTTKSTVEHAPFGQKVTTFPSAPNQPNNVVYLSSPGNIHPVAIPNSKVNWPGASGLSLPMFPTGKTDKGGFATMKGKETSPKMVYPYPISVSSVQPTMSSNAASSAASKVQLKQHDLAQVLQGQQTTAKSSIIGRTEPTLSGHQTTKVSNADKVNITRTVSKPPDPLNQPLQYCGILLQPGMVPQVQFPGARSNVSLGNNQEQNPGGNLYTVQGLSYGSNVGNPAVLGMTPNTVIPYFLGIAQPSAIPKPIVPGTSSVSTTKESTPTSSTTPVSTSAIAAAYSAFVSIAPASVTNSSFSQQLVNLVSNYNNPYWQHLLTQGANSNTLAYQLMQIGQYSTRPGLATQATKSPTGKNLSHTQTKITTQSSKSVASSGQESKTKSSIKDSLSVSSSGSVAMTSCTIRSTPLTVATTSDTSEGKGLHGITITSKSSTSKVDTCTDGDTKVVSSDESLKEKTIGITNQSYPSTSDAPVTSLACTTGEITHTPSSSGSEKVTSTTENLEECMVYSGIKTIDSSAESERVDSAEDILSEKSDSTSNEVVHSDSLEKKDSGNVHTTESIDSPGGSASIANQTVPLVNESSTKKVDCAGKESLTLLNHITPENSSFNTTKGDATSDNISEEVETNTLPQNNLIKPDDSCEMNPAVSDTVLQNTREICHENGKPNTVTDVETPRDVLKDSISESVTVDCSNSSTEKTDVPNVCIDARFTDESENKKNDACTLEETTVNLENYSTISECKKAELESTNNGLSNVTTLTEELNNKRKDDHLNSGNVDNEVGNVGSECEDSIAVNNDNASNITENEPVEDVKNELLNQIDLETDIVKDDLKNLKTDLLKKTGVEIDLVNDGDSQTNVIEDADMKTDSCEKNDQNETNALEGDKTEETSMETGEASGKVSSEQNCDEDVKVSEDTVTPVDTEVQNGEIESMSNDTGSTKAVVNKEKEKPEAPVEFTIGDIVWAQARGLPSWPGKIVDERDVGNGKVTTDVGKKWVMWFGDHTFSQVEVEKLKTLTEGLKTLDDKGRKRKYRGKKTRIGLEQAIGEALEELDQRERLRSRQGPKAKKRRL